MFVPLAAPGAMPISVGMKSRLTFITVALACLAGCASDAYRPAEQVAMSVDEAKQICSQAAIHATSSPIGLGILGGAAGGLIGFDQRISIHRQCMADHGWLKD